MNKLFLDRVNDLEDYVRTKKNNIKICFHCEDIEDFNNNFKLLELFKKEISINNIIFIGYKGSLFVKKLNYQDYKYYKSFIDNDNINNKEFQDLNMYYCNNSYVDLAGRRSSDIIATLILYYVKIYMKIPYNEKDEAKSRVEERVPNWGKDKKKRKTRCLISYLQRKP